MVRGVFESFHETGRSSVEGGERPPATNNTVENGNLKSGQQKKTQKRRKKNLHQLPLRRQRLW